MARTKEPWAHGDALRRGLESGPPRAGASTSTNDAEYSGSGYQAANSSPARSALLSFPTNSLKEATKQTRTELTRKVRALDANLGIITRIIAKIGQHAVGKGIFVRPTTQDQEWNDASRKLFEEWASNPAVYSLDASRDHYEDQRLVGETMVGDGEYFAGLVNSENGAPMIQPFDCFEVESPTGVANAEALAYLDGVKVNRYLRPTHYSVRELDRPGVYGERTYREVAAADMLHVFRRRRAKGTRGLTWFFSGLNQGIDALDLRALEVGTAKLHSALAVSVKKNGKLNRKGAFDKIKSHGAGETPADENFSALERIYGGGLIAYLGQEGEIELHTSQRPSANLLEFLRFLYCDIAMAVGIPLEVVYSLASLGGATARGALEDAQWLFEMVMDKIIWGHSYPIYRWRTARFMNEGRLRRCKDPMWWSTSWRGPAKLTVDIGRTADSNIKLLKNGALTYSRYYDERSLEVRDEWAQQIEDIAWLQERCAARGVDINRILEQTPGSVTQVNMPEAGPN